MTSLRVPALALAPEERDEVGGTYSAVAWCSRSWELAEYSYAVQKKGL